MLKMRKSSTQLRFSEALHCLLAPEPWSGITLSYIPSRAP